MKPLTFVVTFFVALSTCLMPMQALAELCCESEAVSHEMSAHCHSAMESSDTNSDDMDRSMEEHSCLSACCHFSALAPILVPQIKDEREPKNRILTWGNQDPNNLAVYVFRPPILS